MQRHRIARAICNFQSCQRQAARIHPAALKQKADGGSARKFKLTWHGKAVHIVSWFENPTSNTRRVHSQARAPERASSLSLHTAVLQLYAPISNRSSDSRPQIFSFMFTHIKDILMFFA